MNYALFEITDKWLPFNCAWKLNVKVFILSLMVTKPLQWVQKAIVLDYKAAKAFWTNCPIFQQVRKRNFNKNKKSSETFHTKQECEDHFCSHPIVIFTSSSSKGWGREIHFWIMCKAAAHEWARKRPFLNYFDLKIGLLLGFCSPQCWA